jgi:hypothetical protein
MLRNSFSGKVQNKVISGPKNLYFKGFTKQIKFLKRYQFLYFNDGNYGKFSVTSNSSRSVEFNAMVVFRIPYESVFSIYSSYRENYVNEIVKRVNEVVKNSASNFSIEDYLTQPSTIEALYSQVIKTELAKIHVDTPPLCLHLKTFFMPPDIYSRYLTSAQQSEMTLTKQYQYDAERIRLDTSTLVALVNANTTKIARETTILVQNIKAEANATASKILQSATGTGLNTLFTTLGILGNSAMINKYFFYMNVINGGLTPNVINAGSVKPSIVLGNGFSGGTSNFGIINNV